MRAVWVCVLVLAQSPISQSAPQIENEEYHPRKESLEPPPGFRLRGVGLISEHSDVHKEKLIDTGSIGIWLIETQRAAANTLSGIPLRVWAIVADCLSVLALILCIPYILKAGSASSRHEMPRCCPDASELGPLCGAAGTSRREPFLALNQ